MVVSLSVTEKNSFFNKVTVNHVQRLQPEFYGGFKVLHKTLGKKKTNVILMLEIRLNEFLD